MSSHLTRILNLISLEIQGLHKVIKLDEAEYKKSISESMESQIKQVQITLEKSKKLFNEEYY